MDTSHRALGKVRYPHGAVAHRELARPLANRNRLADHLRLLGVDLGHRSVAGVRHPDGPGSRRDSARTRADVDGGTDLIRIRVDSRDRVVALVGDPDPVLVEGHVRGIGPDRDLDRRAPVQMLQAQERARVPVQGPDRVEGNRNRDRITARRHRRSRLPIGGQIDRVERRGAARGHPEAGGGDPEAGGPSADLHRGHREWA